MQTVIARYSRCIAIVSCVIYVPLAAALTNIVESGKKHELATRIEETYLKELDVRNRTGLYAIEKLMSEGFRCEVKPKDDYGYGLPPRIKCLKNSLMFGVLCRELSVSLSLDREPEINSRKELLAQLDTRKVYGFGAFCPPDVELPVGYLVKRKNAEQALRAYIETLSLEGSAGNAYQILMEQGFYCGYDTDQKIKGAIDLSRLVCSMWPSKIDFCFEPKIILDIEWSKGDGPPSPSLSHINKSRVKAVHSRCEIPAVKSNGNDGL